ncbi:TPA: hypothetical protein HA278_07095 [Candidatus Woesearchaeota archaeon]|nr:hypothetical protein [archaeon]HIJ11798.1 hypothetical protein [Candidatus Woesearchaeota archaeon]
MPLLRVPVQCTTCKDAIDLSSALLVDKTQKQYQCYACYQNNSNPAWGYGKEQIKQNHYCERCKYKFVSTKLRCPYCNKGDRLSNPNITVHDLL